MMLSSGFFVFFFFTLPPWFSSTLALHQWMFEGKPEMTEIAMESSVCYSKPKLLSRGLFLVVEEWARATSQNCFLGKE